jgi:predicted Zn-dependent protease
MTTVSVQLSNVGTNWATPCRKAVTVLNDLFRRNQINVVLTMSHSAGPTITVKVDPGIQGSAVHGRTTAESTDTGRLLRAEVRLPVKVTINTPSGQRDAGPGILEVIAGHEFVHALGHSAHNSHLMGQTMQKELGDSGAGDRLRAGGVRMPPLTLAQESVSQLKTIWN